MRVVGVDVGGSGVRAATVSARGDVGPVQRVVLPDREVETVVRAVASVVEAHGGADAIGVGVPGFVRGGVVRASPNFPSWRDVDIARRLADATGARVAVENDANAAALGHVAQRGDGRDLVLLGLGTGVGGGIVLGGHLRRGANGAAAELGHLHVGGDAVCGCGNRGCLETWAGTVGLVARARALGREVSDGKGVVDAAAAGEAWAAGLLADAGRALGVAMGLLVNTLAPDVIVVSGGLVAAERWLRPAADAALAASSVAAARDGLTVDWLPGSDTWAIAGAGASAWSLA
jgi:glucokinase